MTLLGHPIESKMSMSDAASSASRSPSSMMKSPSCSTHREQSNSPGRPCDREMGIITLSPVTSDITRISLYSPSPGTTTTTTTAREARSSPIEPLKGVVHRFLYALPDLTLLEVLRERTRRPVALSDYKHYLQNVEHGSEMLEFYLAVEQLPREDNRVALQYLISQIIDRFIRAG